MTYQRRDAALFSWLLFAGLCGTLIGVPWAVAVTRDPADAWSPAVLVPYGTFSTAIGMVLGWLFMRYGLVSAIVAQFAADVVQGVIPRVVAAIA